MSEDIANTGPAGSPSRNPRLGLACLRCQKRKIKCGGELPKCNNCVNAAAACTDGVSVRLKDMPRAQITRLKKRVAWLESIIREKCPEIDLTSGHQPADEILPTTHDDSIVDAIENGSTEPITVDDEIVTATVADSSTPIAPPALDRTFSSNTSSHEIGLVALGHSQDSRYIGPSSGYFLARILLTKSTKLIDASSLDKYDASLPAELIDSVYGSVSLPPKSTAVELVRAYFEFIHPQYPIIHQQSFYKTMDQAYKKDNTDAVVAFQMFMVLALGSVMPPSGTRARMASDSYCNSALQHFHLINVENSLQGLQCLLLLQLFAIHNSSAKLNCWYLNYQCIAAVLDLGLQRNITIASGISLLEQELRTRVFWVVILLDRVIATMMGRPIGIRDEACDLRLPQLLRDSQLVENLSPSQIVPSLEFSRIEFSIHLFRAAKLNSEIKYIANSVNREIPTYAFPPIRNVQEWQFDMLHRLDDWATQIPTVSGTTRQRFMQLTCQLRHHSLRMILLRPSPAIPKPSPTAQMKCFESARSTLEIYDEIHRANILIHNWMTFYGIVMGSLTMMYCIKADMAVASAANVDTLMRELSISQSIMSAIGEHWSGAKTCRIILSDLGNATVRWLQDVKASSKRSSALDDNSRQQISRTRQHRRTSAHIQQQQQQQQRCDNPEYTSDNTILSDASPSQEGPFFTNNTTQGDILTNTYGEGGYDDMPFSSDFFNASDSINMDNIIHDLFQDFITTNPPFG